MLRRRRKVGAATAEAPRKLHNRMAAMLYATKNDSQVTPLGVYKTNWGRSRRV